MSNFKLVDYKELFEIHKNRVNLSEKKAKRWLAINKVRINYRLKKSAKHDKDIKAIFHFSASSCNWDMLKEICILIAANNTNYSATYYRSDLMTVDLEINVRLGGVVYGTT